MSQKNHSRAQDSGSIKENKELLSRRKFISALGATTAGLMLGACSKAQNPFAPENDKSLERVLQPNSPNGLPAAKEKLATVAQADVFSYDRQVIRREIEAMLDALGGLGDIIKPGDRVGIKINLTGEIYSAQKAQREFGLPPQELYWTHPEILRAVGELLKDAGAGKIIVVESIYNQESYETYGYKEAVDYLGAEFVDTNEPAPYADYMDKAVGDGWNVFESFPQNAILHEVDCFVSLPKSKRHVGAGITNSMKNLVGTIPAKKFSINGSSHRAAIHANGNGQLVRTILDLNKARPIHLAVCDAIKTAKNGEGPWNSGFAPDEFNTLVVSKDPVAADSVATLVIGCDPMAPDGRKPWGQDLPDTDNYLKLAQEQGMGIYDLDQIEIINTTQNTGVAKIL